jgi:3-dehydroquinate dehydratase I
MNPLATLMKAGRPIVAVSFDDAFKDEALARAQAAGVEVAELRVDLFKSLAPAHVLEVARRYAAMPRLITLRSAAEGGRWNGTEGQRFELYAALMPEAAAIDIELGSCEICDLLIELATSKGVLKVVSYHNFTETPDDQFLLGVLLQSKGQGADLVKISVFARSEADLRRLARFTLDHSDQGLITISMGPLGSPSRVLFPALGSRLTYADIGLGTGPGQLRYDVLCDMLRQLYPGFPQEKRPA